MRALLTVEEQRAEQSGVVRSDPAGLEDRGLVGRALARKYQVHRRTVREALSSAWPRPRKKPPPRKSRLDPFKPAIDAMLRADLDAPRKQRHTERRIFDRLVAEQEMEGISYATVSDYVGWRRPDIRREAGREPAQVFIRKPTVPAGTPRSTSARCGSTWPASAQRARVENERWVAFRSHYGIDAFYCTPGVEGAHEKGGVEGEIGRFRRNHLVPVPAVESLIELNALIDQWDAEDDDRRIGSRPHTVGEHFAIEQPLLARLPDEPFETGRPFTPRVDRFSQVTVRMNRYSVPVRLIGRQVRVLRHASELVDFDGRREVARHQRLTGRLEVRLELDHYLEALVRKPGALPGATALEQARAAGKFTPVHDAWWAAVRKARGDAAGYPRADRSPAAAPQHGPRTRGRQDRHRPGRSPPPAARAASLARGTCGCPLLCGIDAACKPATACSSLLTPLSPVS